MTLETPAFVGPALDSERMNLLLGKSSEGSYGLQRVGHLWRTNLRVYSIYVEDEKIRRLDRHCLLQLVRWEKYVNVSRDPALDWTQRWLRQLQVLSSRDPFFPGGRSCVSRSDSTCAARLFDSQNEKRKRYTLEYESGMEFRAVGVDFPKAFGEWTLRSCVNTL